MLILKRREYIYRKEQYEMNKKKKSVNSYYYFQTQYFFNNVGEEPASCYRKVAGSIPLVCMSQCPWACQAWTKRRTQMQGRIKIQQAFILKFQATRQSDNQKAI